MCRILFVFFCKFFFEVILALVVEHNSSIVQELFLPVAEQVLYDMTACLSPKLKFLYIKGTITRILTWCAVAVIILTLVITENLIIALGFLVIAIVVGKQSGRATKRSGEIKELLGESAINDAIRDVLGDDVEYNPVGSLKPGSVEVPFDYERSFGEHHIKTAYNGVNIELGSIILLDFYESLHEETGESMVTALDRFKGPWLICDFGKKPACGVYIFPSGQKKAAKI